MPKASSSALKSQRKSNLIVAGALGASVMTIYFYTMWSARDQAFTDEELNMKIKK